MDDFNIHSNRNDEIQHAVHGTDSTAKKGGPITWFALIGVFAIVVGAVLWAIG